MLKYCIPEEGCRMTRTKRCGNNLNNAVDFNYLNKVRNFNDPSQSYRPVFLNVFIIVEHLK